MSVLSALLTCTLVVFLAYMGVNWRSAYLERHADHADRVDFLNDPKVFRMPFLKNIVEESRKISHEGVWMPAFAMWIERSILYRTVTLSSTNVQIGLGVILIVAMYLFYRFMVNKYETDKLAESVERVNVGMERRTAMLDKFREAEAARAAARAVPPPPVEDDDESEVVVAPTKKSNTSKITQAQIAELARLKDAVDAFTRKQAPAPPIADSHAPVTA